MRKDGDGQQKDEGDGTGIASQYFNATRETSEHVNDYAKTLLVIAPNVIVLERLKLDFQGGAIFRNDPVIPRELEISWDFDCVMRGEGAKAHSEGALFLTNIQQFYERAECEDDEPEAMTSVLGPKPPTKKLEITDFGDRIALRAGKLLVVNDEAHHTHDEDIEWNKVIRGLHEKTPLTAQLDFFGYATLSKGCDFPVDRFGLPAEAGHYRWDGKAADEGNRENRRGEIRACQRPLLSVFGCWG